MKQPKDINLIPESERAFSLTKTIPYLIVFGAIIVATAIFAVFTFTLKVASQNDVNNAQTDLAEKNTEWAHVASEAAQINSLKTKLAAYQTFQATHPLPTYFVDLIKKHLPSSATLVSFDTDYLGKANLQVKMPSAANAYQLFNELNAEPKFSSVVLSSINKSSEAGEYIINFSLTIKTK